VNPAYLQFGVLLALTMALAGIFARKRQSECWMLPVNLAVVLVGDTAMILFPEQLFHWKVYVLQQWIYSFCTFGVALELARRAFKAFPGAAVTARVVFLAILIVTALSIFAATPPGNARGSSFSVAAVLTLQPRLINATIWLFVAASRLVMFFNIPVSDWHRSVSLGFSIYLVISVTLLNLLKTFGFDIRSFITFFDGSAFLALCSWFALRAWQPEEAREVIPDSVRRLAGARA
jgi:hypothetical protein